MAGKYQVYPSYKDSGVMWLGDVPEKWTVTKIGYLSHKTGSGKTPKGGSEIYSDSGVLFLRSQNVYDTGIVLKEDDVVFISEKIDEEMAASRVLNGDILLNITGASIGRTCIVPKGFPSANVNQHVCIIRTPSSLRKYLSLYLKSASTKAQIDSAQNGAAREGLNFEQLSNIVVCLPDNELERDAISNFLDHETAKIDTLIEKQQQLIALLKEKRQAVISHAVTKGLNANAPMRDSGVEWLGEVPVHWETTRLKYMKSTEPNAFVDGPFGSNLKSVHFVENGDVYVIESNFATTGLIDINKLKKVSKDHFEIIKRSSTKGGDIIIAKIGARYGSSSILPILDKNAVVSGNSLKLTVNPTLLNVEYANELLRVLKENDAMDEGVNVTAQPALSLGGLNNLPFLKTPIEEQNEIVNHIKSMKEKFNGLISNADRFIALAKERRAALISAAVTGKIDVRNWQAPETNHTSRKGISV
jgi:type I restriction enzyme S subunit